VNQSYAEAAAEVRRRDALEKEWLGATLEGRPSFAEVEKLEHAGVPACHRWEVPSAPPPDHLTCIAALRRWQAGACAVCSTAQGRLVVDHSHATGLVCGLLCSSCNTAEGVGAAQVFAAYRDLPPAAMLELEEQYGSVWDGFALDPARRDERNAAHVDAAEALFAGITDRFR
jgi:hypothetical protein